MPSTMQEKINDLLMKELSRFFEKLILDMETDENTEGFTLDTIMKYAEEYFKVGASKPKTAKPKAVKEKKQIDESEQCVALKKDGTRCSKKKTTKPEYTGSEIEDLCTSHIKIHVDNKSEVKEIVQDSKDLDEIDPPFEVKDETKPKKTKKTQKKEVKETIEEDEL